MTALEDKRRLLRATPPPIKSPRAIQVYLSPDEPFDHGCGATRNRRSFGLDQYQRETGWIL